MELHNKLDNSVYKVIFLQSKEGADILREIIQNLDKQSSMDQFVVSHSRAVQPSNNLAAEKETKDLETEIAELMKVLNTIEKKEKMLIKVFLGNENPLLVRLRKYWKNPSMNRFQRRTLPVELQLVTPEHHNVRDDEDKLNLYIHNAIPTLPLAHQVDQVALHLSSDRFI